MESLTSKNKTSGIFIYLFSKWACVYVSYCIKIHPFKMYPNCNGRKKDKKLKKKTLWKLRAIVWNTRLTVPASALLLLLFIYLFIFVPFLILSSVSFSIYSVSGRQLNNSLGWSRPVERRSFDKRLKLCCALLAQAYSGVEGLAKGTVAVETESAEGWSDGEKRSYQASKM